LGTKLPAILGSAGVWCVTAGGCRALPVDAKHYCILNNACKFLQAGKPAGVVVPGMFASQWQCGG